MHDVIILTQNEAIGARPPSLAVAAPMALFWVRIVMYLCIHIKRAVYPHHTELISHYVLKSIAEQA